MGPKSRVAPQSDILNPIRSGVPRAIAFFKMGMGCHGLGVLDKAVRIEHSHGLTEDGKAMSPHREKGDGPGNTHSVGFS